MAEEQVIQQTLVLDGNREKLSKRINNINSNLQDQELGKQRSLFCSLFMQLCYRYYKIKRSDLKEITDNEELLALESEVFKRVESAFKLTKYVGIPIMILIPGAGWASLVKMLYNTFECYGRVHYYDSDFIAFRYCKWRRKLIEIDGKKFLSEALKNLPPEKKY